MYHLWRGLTEKGLMQDMVPLSTENHVYSPHVFFSDEDTNSRSTRQSPVFANEMELRLNVINQQCHIMREVEVTHLKHQWVAQHSLTTYTVNLEKIYTVKDEIIQYLKNM